MLKDIEKSIYIDPLTGLPNFFKFVECDVQQVFNKCGVVIIFDFIKFTGVNEKYGTEIGDLCLKALSKVIDNELVGQRDFRGSVYRTDGDEFTVILPSRTHGDATRIAGLIKENFKEIMYKHGYYDVNLRELIVEYTDEIKSISKLYQLIFKSSLEGIKRDQGEPFGERWVEHIIDSFTKRISETLLFFNDAYVMAMADDISGLPNHRAGRSYLSDLVEITKQTNEEFSILFIDGDNLKRYNEISYQSGNKMIRELSSIISRSLRKNDRVFRWLTGDEFLVVLPNVDNEDALKLAERTRRAVEDQTKEWIYPVTISIGVAHYTNDSTSFEDIINQAERANSFAKNQGKNRVVRWCITHEDDVIRSINCS